MSFKEEIRAIKEQIAEEGKKKEVLRDLDLFVLDNSIRESTVGQLRGHTLENKWAIYNESKKCGFKNNIVAAFSHMTRVDDVFCKALIDKGEDPTTLYAFTEHTLGVVKGIPDEKTVPTGLAKMKEVGLQNPIIELDLVDDNIDYERFNMERLCKHLEHWIDWTFKNLSKDAKIHVGIRDFGDAMIKVPERVLTVAKFLSSLPKAKKLAGITIEEQGKYFPEEVGAWVAALRKVMDKNGLKGGNLLVHIHRKWGHADTIQLECLINGANGIWASLCEEGASVGHACSTVTLMNLVRMNNKKVLKRYNCAHLREAAINVTKITTGNPPPIKQIVYGERSLDLAFSLAPYNDFDLAAFFGERAPVRISSISTAKMVLQRLIDLFGNDPQFTEEMASKMKEVMYEDLRGNTKEEYMSSAGLAILFDRSGGKLTPKMQQVIQQDAVTGQNAKNLIDQIRKIWDEWDLRDAKQGDDALEFFSFYNGFMAPYFGCYKCDETRRGLQALDMDADGFVQWKEFSVYLKWALRQYPEIKDTDELLSIVFRKGLIPAMHDEIIKKR